MVGRIARVGITGGVAEGKSTVLRYLREAGYRTASADDVARQALRSADVRKVVAAAAGLPADFSRAALRDRLFDDVAARRAVNAVLHPYVVGRLIATGAEFVEAPLLIETALQRAFDEVWVVTCGASEQRRRLAARVGSETLADRILALQLPTSAKLPFADVIVRTNLSRRRVKLYTLEAALRAKNLGVANRAK
ncbi:MAG: dephospho-CoA kinase [Fimbriimonadaceae bacterium]